MQITSLGKMLWLAALSAILLRRDNVVAALQKGGGQGKTKPAYQISPKPCWVDGVEGTCMFVYECIKSEGYHVGMCVDTFMFGSCCAYNATTNAVTSQAHGHDQNHHHQPHHQPQHGSGKPSVLYTPPSQTTAKRPATTSRPKYTSRPQPNSSTSSQNQQRPPASASSSISHKPSPSSSTSTTVKQRPATPPPRHSIRPMSTDILHGSNTILVSEYTKPHHQQHQHLMGAKPYHQYQSWPHQQQQQIPQTQNQHQQSSTKPGWQATTEPGFITGHNSITKPTANWQVTTEPGFVTKVKTKPGNAGYKVKPTKKPFPVTTAKNATKYGSKSTSTTTAVPSTHSTFSTTLSTVAPSKRPSNPLLSSLMYITSTLANSNKISSPPPPPSSSLPQQVTSSTTSSPSLPSLSSLTSQQANPDPDTSTASTVSAATADNVACGQPILFPQPQTRIVGGKNAPFGRWPWQVSVRRTSFFGFSSTHRCGGAILNENWIATAGHCVDDLLTSQIRIRVGEYDFSSVQEDLPYVERAVARKVVHPKYNFFTYEYDLALVQLEQPLQFAAHISPICLPASDDLLIGENATVTGWGRLSEGGTLPSVLQEVQVPIVSNDNCKSMFLRAGRHEFIPEIFLCAGHEGGGQDSCQGDSGGPLQVRGKDGRYFLAGIISWGIGCAEANLPGVCTRISKFVPWILNNVT